MINPTINGRISAEQEWELQEAAHYANQEGESEAESEFAFRKLLSGVRQAAQTAVPVARQLAPVAAQTLVGSAPPPLARSLLNALLRDGESAARSLEVQMFGANQLEAEIGTGETAYEAALAEVLAAEASHSESESEAEAFLGAAVPGIVKSMGGGDLRAVLPTLVFANARLVKLLHRKGPEGRRLLRLLPTLMRRTVASLKAAQRSGQSLNSQLALRLMAEHLSQIFGQSQVVTEGMIRNAVIQKRTVR